MIDFQNIYKSYGGQDIFVGVTFRVNANERVGVVGPNGAGKSTLFGLITEEIGPDKGEISKPRAARIGYLRQHLDAEAGRLPLLDYVEDAIPEVREVQKRLQAIEEELAAETPDAARRGRLLDTLGEAQHHFETLGGYQLKTRAEIALSGLGFAEKDFQRPLNAFSGGWRMRASLARVLISDPDILLLDEPSNYLDVPAVEWLDRFLKSYQGTLLLISHDRYLLKTLTDVTLEVNAGQVIRYAGDYDFYARSREDRVTRLEAAKRNQDRKRDQLERFVERFRAKNTKASQAKSREKALEKMEEIVVPDDLRYSGAIRVPPPPRCGAEVLRLDNVGLTYDGKNWVLRGVNLRIENGDKIAVVGYNGMGKTTLLRALAGVLPLSEGTRTEGTHVVIGYQAQEFGEILPPDKTAFDIINGVAGPGGERKVSVRDVLGAFGFCGDDVYKPCSALSGGEKIRLCFARIFMNPPNCLILDEPTTHLDIAAREALQRTIADYQGAVCLVSHDIEFIRATAATIVAVTRQGVTRYYGDYDYYREKSASAPSDQSVGGQPSEEDVRDIRKERRRERAEKRAELAGTKKTLETRVAAAEKSLEELEARQKDCVEKLSSGAADTDYAGLSKTLKETRTAIARVTEEWETVASELEAFMKTYRAVHED